jgi:hypothetical protein
MSNVRLVFGGVKKWEEAGGVEVLVQASVEVCFGVARRWLDDG